MRKNNLIDFPVPALPCGLDLSALPVYRPFSYYVLGGIDVDGEAMLMNADVYTDSDEEIAAGCAVDGSSDPRVSGFDIAEQSGIDAYERMRERAASSQHSESSDTQDVTNKS